jgi:hypothetical protein
VNLKNSFENAKRKIKDNAPIIMASAVAIGSAAVVVYSNRKVVSFVDATHPRGDFALHLSGREFNKLKSGIPRTTGFDDEGIEVVIATKDMLKEEALERISKLILKD